MNQMARSPAQPGQIAFGRNIRVKNRLGGQTEPAGRRLSERFRRLVETRYSVEFGVDPYRQLSDELTADGTLTDCERGAIS